MISVKVTYTVPAAFAAKNQENINRFMTDFKALNSDDFRYTAYICADGKTFVHHSVYRNEAIQQQLLGIPSFRSFQQQRDNSGLEGMPQIDLLTVVAASHELL